MDPNLSPGILSPGDMFNMEVDTQQRLASAFGEKSDFSVPAPQGLPETTSAPVGDIKKTEPPKDIFASLFSDDLDVSEAAKSNLDRYIGTQNRVKYNANFKIDTPWAEAEKFVDTKLGFDPTRDNEAFHYNNDYMSHGWAMRNLVLNPLKFTGRLLGGTIAKIGESLGYMGSMVTNIGENNYFEKIADNGFSKWFETKEDWMKNRLIPVFKQAGFDEKGFFSKLGDWTFWNDSVADAGAFMLSAVAQTFLTSGVGSAMGLGRLGAVAINTEAQLGRLGQAGAAFGKGLDFTIKGLTGADDLAGVANHAFNTASEAFFESAGVFKQTKKDLIAQGYTEEEAAKIASQRAAFDFKGNLMALTLSNAFENRFIFQPLKKWAKGTNVTNRGAGNANMRGFSADAETSLLAEKQIFKYKTKAGKLFNWKDPQGKLWFYGGRALGATAMEGLYEENIQLAMERLARYGEYDKAGFLESVAATGKQMKAQTFNAMKDRDTPWQEDVLSRHGAKPATNSDLEAGESIGLGALIGIGGTSITAKITGERKKEIAYTNRTIEDYNELRRQFLSTKDIYKLKEDGTHELDEHGNLVFDEEKAAIQAKGLSEHLQATKTADDLINPISRKLIQDSLLANFIHAANVAGLGDRLIERFEGLAGKSPEEIKALGFNPAEMNTGISEMAQSVRELVDLHKEAFKSEVLRPKGVSPAEFAQNKQNRQFWLFKAKSLAKSANEAFNLINNSITENNIGRSNINTDPGVVEHNSLILQLGMLDQFQFVTGGDMKSHFYTEHQKQRVAEIEDKLENLKESLKDKLDKKDLVETADGLYVSPDTKVKDIGDRIDIDNLKRHASIQNTAAQWAYTAQKLDSFNNGYKNFLDLMSFNQVEPDVETEEEDVEEEVPTETPTPQSTLRVGDRSFEDYTEMSNALRDGEISATQFNEAVDKYNAVSPTKVEKAVISEDVPTGEQDVNMEDRSARKVYTSLTSAMRQTVNLENDKDVNDEVKTPFARVSSDDYTNQIATFIKTELPNLLNAGIYTPYIIKETAELLEARGKDKEGYKGEVIVFQDDKGNLKTLPSGMPVVISFNKNGFKKNLEARINDRNKNLGVTDSREFFAKEQAINMRAREMVTNGTADKIRIVIDPNSISSGIYETTEDGVPVVQRFPEFELRVLTSDEVIGGQTFTNKKAVAVIGKNAIPVITQRVAQDAELKNNIEALLAKNYKSKNDAIEVIQYLKTVLYVTMKNNFRWMDDGNGNFTVIFVKDGKRASVADITNPTTGARINIKRAAMENGYTKITPTATGIKTEEVSAEDYMAWIKGRVITNRKVVYTTNEDGSVNKNNLFFGSVNPYFNFTIQLPLDIVTPTPAKTEATPEAKPVAKPVEKEKVTEVATVKSSLLDDSDDVAVEVIKKFKLKDSKNNPFVIDFTPEYGKFQYTNTPAKIPTAEEKVDILKSLPAGLKGKTITYKGGEATLIGNGDNGVMYLDTNFQAVPSNTFAMLSFTDPEFERQRQEFEKTLCN